MKQLYTPQYGDNIDAARSFIIIHHHCQTINLSNLQSNVIDSHILTITEQIQHYQPDLTYIPTIGIRTSYRINYDSYDFKRRIIASI